MLRSVPARPAACMPCHACQRHHTTDPSRCMRPSEARTSQPPPRCCAPFLPSSFSARQAKRDARRDAQPDPRRDRRRLRRPPRAGHGRQPQGHHESACALRRDRGRVDAKRGARLGLHVEQGRPAAGHKVPHPGQVRTAQAGLAACRARRLAARPRGLAPLTLDLPPPPPPPAPSCSCLPAASGLTRRCTTRCSPSARSTASSTLR